MAVEAMQCRKHADCSATDNCPQESLNAAHRGWSSCSGWHSGQTSKSPWQPRPSRPSHTVSGAPYESCLHTLQAMWVGQRRRHEKRYRKQPIAGCSKSVGVCPSWAVATLPLTEHSRAYVGALGRVPLACAACFYCTPKPLSDLC